MLTKFFSGIFLFFSQNKQRRRAQTLLPRMRGGISRAYRAPLLLLILLSACQQSPPESPTASQQPVFTRISISTSQPSAAVEEPPPQTPTATPIPPPTTVSSPTPEANPDAGCSQPGQLSLQLLPVPALNQTLEFYVYLPPCSADSPVDFPTLILLHGQGYENSQWLQLGLVKSADRLILSGHIPPLVVLLPLERYELQDPMDSNFDELIMDSLLPWAAEFLPACTVRACVGIGGISRGGAWAMRLGVTYPERFSVIGMHSAPTFPLDHYGQLYSLHDQDVADRPRLYLDAGEQDTYYDLISGFHEDLLNLDIEHTWMSAPGGHENAYWQAQLETYLLWYGSQLSPPSSD